MMEISWIMVPGAPPPFALVSHAVRAWDFTFAPDTGAVFGEDVAAQARDLVAAF